ncbi:hypothetical protein [Streptomyces asiaticus]
MTAGWAILLPKRMSCPPELEGLRDALVTFVTMMMVTGTAL